MQRWLRFGFVLFAIVASPAGASAQTGDTEDAELGEVLALCRSTDVAAQRFCLRRVSTLPIEHEGASEALWHLAQQPGPVGQDAKALFRVRYGEEAAGPLPAPGPVQTPEAPPTPPAPPPAPSTPAPVYPTAPPPAPVPAPPQEAAPAPAPVYGPVPYRAPVYGSSAAYERARAAAGRPRPNDPSRLHFAPTGFVLDEGQRLFTFQGPGFYKISAGIGKNLQIDGGLVFPAGILAGIVNLRYAVPFDIGSLAIHGSIGGAWLPAFENREGGFALFRGGATLSIGSRDYFLNLGIDVGGGFYRFVDLSPTDGGQLLVATTAGFSARISRAVSIRAEGIMPALYRSGDGDHWGFGQFGVAGWGFRFQAPRAFVDLSLNYLLHEDMWRIYHIWPFGLPWLSVGFEI